MDKKSTTIMRSDIHIYFQELEEALSQERLDRYKALTGDMASAFELYRLNMLLCERLYVPLHILEVVLRNKIDGVLSETYGPEWIENDACNLNHRQAEKILQTKGRLAKSKPNYIKGHLIADLTLGFWSSFFNKEYENLWQKTLHKIAKTREDKGLTRGYYSKRMNDIRDLRNRVAHHEPIYYLNLPLLYQYILDVIHSLSRPAFEWVKEHASFEAMLEEYYFLTKESK